MIARVPLVASDADVLRISAENPCWRIERDASGALTMTPPAGMETSKRNALLTHMVFEWAELHCYVAFDSNGGFRLPDTSIVAPDAALLSHDSWASLTAKEREGFFPGAPAVAVELCSYSDTPSLLQAKLERMRRAGTAYVILVDPYRRSVWTDGTPPEDFDLDFQQLLK